MLTSPRTLLGTPGRPLSKFDTALSTPPTALDNPAASVGRGPTLSDREGILAVGRVTLSDGSEGVGKDNETPARPERESPTLGRDKLGRGAETVGSGRLDNKFVGSGRLSERLPKREDAPSRLESRESTGTLLGRPLGRPLKRLVAPRRPESAESRGTLLVSPVGRAPKRLVAPRS